LVLGTSSALAELSRSEKLIDDSTLSSSLTALNFLVGIFLISEILWMEELADLGKNAFLFYFVVGFSYSVKS